MDILREAFNIEQESGAIGCGNGCGTSCGRGCGRSCTGSATIETEERQS